MSLDVAIIGGGASGLATAHFLDEAHRVVLYERDDVLGGHIRTLGKNVRCAALPPGVFLDAGVVELDRTNFPHVHAYLASLGVPAVDVVDGGSSNLYLADGTHYHSPAFIREEHPDVLARLRARADLVPLAIRRRRFLRGTAAVARTELEHQAIEAYLGDDDFSCWVRALLMYAYSMPYEDVREISAGLAVPMLRDFLNPNRWTTIRGGMATYVDRVASSLRGETNLGARLRGVRRVRGGVEVVDEAGHARRFDRVVLAVPPHRALDVLLDPTDAEIARFRAFEGSVVHTVVHTDTSLHERVGATHRSEFDLFELPSGAHGYDAYLNRLSGLPDDAPPHYGLAFGLDEAIDPAKVVHRQRHDVSHYTERALEHRGAIERAQGENGTFVVGAFLGDGLHEGAVRSALSVSRALGGRDLVVAAAVLGER